MSSTDRSRVDFGVLLEAMPDAVLVADMDSHIVYANAAVERLLAWRADELVGETLHAIQPERLHRTHDAGFGRYAATGTRTLFGRPIRVPARRSDGVELDVELNLAEIRDRGGRRLVVGVLRDLSDRVELERNLRVLRYLKATTAAAARLWTGLEPTLVLRTLTDVLVDDFDAALARTWIYEPESESLRMITSGGLSTRVAESSRYRIDLATYPYKVGVVARTKQPFMRNGLTGDPDFDQEWVRREGIEAVLCLPLLAGDRLLGVMVYFSRSPIPDEVAETVGHLAALAAAALNDAHLIDQEREARAAADRARGHFELLAAVSERLVSSLNLEETVQSVANAVVPAFADWCVIDLASGASLDMVARAHRDPEKVERIAQLRTSYPPGKRTNPRHAIHRAVESGRTVWESVADADLAARAVDATHLGLLRDLGIGCHVVVPLTARARVVGAVSFVRGPDREAFDAEDVLTAEDIARRTALATDNAQLYRSAQQAIQLRDRFLAVASHELRNPLSVVRGHWELLDRRLAQSADRLGNDSQRVENSLRRLGQGIEHLRRLVEDLLDVDRLRRGAIELELRPVDLVALVQDAVEDLPEDGQGRIHLELPRGPVVGSWDRARLTQVIDNVIGNALKYSPPEGVVEVSLVEKPQVVLVSVHDAGIGIAGDQLESIFEPFNRAPNASASQYSGLGLGLAISREIVEQMSGRMWAESAGESRGSVFWIELARGEVE